MSGRFRALLALLEESEHFLVVVNRKLRRLSSVGRDKTKALVTVPAALSLVHDVFGKAIALEERLMLFAFFALLSLITVKSARVLPDSHCIRKLTS